MTRRGMSSEVCATLRRLIAAAAIAAGLVISAPCHAQGEALPGSDALERRAFAAFGEGRYGDAEAALRELLAAAEARLAADHPLAISTLNSLGIVLKEQGRLGEAIGLYKRALALAEPTLGPRDAIVATLLDNLASAQLKLGELDAAQEAAARAAEIREANGSAGELAASLLMLADIAEAQGRYGDAEPFYRRAVALRETGPGSDDAMLATTLDNFVQFLMRSGRLDEAEPLVLRSLGLRERMLGPNDPIVAGGRNSLAALYQKQGKLAEAEPLYRRSLATFEQQLGSEHPVVASLLNNLASLYDDAGRYAEAEPLYLRSLAIRETALGPDHTAVAISLGNLATVYRNEGRFGDAATLYRRALHIFETALGPDHPQVAVALNNLATFFDDIDNYDEAEPLYRRSLAIRQRTLDADSADLARAYNNLAAVLREKGRLDEASPLASGAVAIFERSLGPMHPELAKALHNLGQLRHAEHRAGEAETLYRRALAIQEATLGDRHPVLATTVNSLATLQRDEKQLDAALETVRRATGLLGARFAQPIDPRSAGRASEQRLVRGTFLLHLELLDAARQAHPERAGPLLAEAFEVAQLTQFGEVGRSVVQMAARFAAGTDALAAAVREDQDLIEERRRAEATLIRQIAKGERDDAVAVALRRTIAGLDERILAGERRLAGEFPRYAALMNPRPLALDAALDLLAPNEALLDYVVGDESSWLIVLRGRQAAMFRLAIGRAALGDEVAGLRRFLDPTTNPHLDPFPVADAYALHQRLLAPAEPSLRGARHLFVIPDGALQRLPLGVLVTHPPKNEASSFSAYRRVPWLARRYAVSVLPSIAALPALRDFARTARAALPFFGIGDPVLGGPPGEARGVSPSVLYRGGQPDLDAIRQLPALPESAGELRAMARAQGAASGDLLLRERATEPALRQRATVSALRRARLDRYRVIAFATHGLMAGDFNIGEPALVLSPPIERTAEDEGLLTASKVAKLKLNADWVILSACNTAADDGTIGAEGLSGLAKAFFYAGTRALLVSHWSVVSEAAVRITTGAIARAAADKSLGRAEAFRLSVVELIDHPPRREFEHPLVWAPFSLVGEGGRGR